MRLIDLDKALTEVEDECRMSDDWKVSHEMMNVFKYQPTVKAIPIEWLCRKYLDINKKSWSAVMCLIVNKIIRAWVKENDGRNC